MRYLGGKSKHKKLFDQAFEGHHYKTIWEPFCGGCGATLHLLRHADRAICSDSHAALISMWQAFLGGWTPQLFVTEESRRNVLLLPDTDPQKAFERFGCGFGGNWASGFARGGGQCYASQSLRSCQKFLATAKGRVSFERRNFCGLSDPRRKFDAIYCDPPYAGTTGYGHDFDHDLFWRVARDHSATAPVYVSEYEAPRGWEVVAEREPIASSVGLRRKDPRPPEKIFFRAPKAVWR